MKWPVSRSPAKASKGQDEAVIVIGDAVRHKPILCQQEVYFLELVRYRNLDSLRAALLVGLKQLDRYPYCGHSVGITV